MFVGARANPVIICSILATLGRKRSFIPTQLAYPILSDTISCSCRLNIMQIGALATGAHPGTAGGATAALILSEARDNHYILLEERNSQTK
eukprot:410802-Amphidinium_carterae.1